ncbi:Low temperature requirement protein A [Stackebrandtia soli]
MTSPLFLTMKVTVPAGGLGGRDLRLAEPTNVHKQQRSRLRIVAILGGRVMSYIGRHWYDRMTPRDTSEPHRAATNLELLFDLVFVVAIAGAASSLEVAIAEGRYSWGVVHFVMVFFAVWWAWMNFTWFASAYDVDDGPYRLLTLVEMGGALVIASGVSAAFNDQDYTIVVAGYVLMRLAMIVQWLRAAAGDPTRRPTALRYAIGIGVAQAGWVGLLLIPSQWSIPVYFALMAVELTVPIWAEHATATPWHPGHIAERYGLFTIIVLGESIGAAVLSMREAADEGGEDVDLYGIAGFGLIIVFCMWWVYFDRDAATLLRGRTSALGWGYGHLVIFGSAAAVGAGLQVAITAATHHDHIPHQVVGASIAIPVIGFLAGVWTLHIVSLGSRWLNTVYAVTIVAVALTVPLPATLALVAICLAGLVAVSAWAGHRFAEAPR